MFGAQELVIILVIVLILFGGSKIPKLARSLGKARKDFEQGYKEGQEGVGSEDESTSAPTDDSETKA
ncbi:MAG: twin-arginine translocase TatA/TatE family subunit [Planctomycetota bacterium]|jgi:sec-independent protein translocase protein TatA